MSCSYKLNLPGLLTLTTLITQIAPSWIQADFLHCQMFCFLAFLDHFCHYFIWSNTFVLSFTCKYPFRVHFEQIRHAINWLTYYSFRLCVQSSASSEITLFADSHHIQVPTSLREAKVGMSGFFFCKPWPFVSPFTLLTCEEKLKLCQRFVSFVAKLCVFTVDFKADQCPAVHLHACMQPCPCMRRSMWLAGAAMAGMSCIARSVFSAPHARCQWWGGGWFTAGSKSHFHTKTGKNSSSTVTSCTHAHSSAHTDGDAVVDAILIQFLAWVRHNLWNDWLWSKHT